MHYMPYLYRCNLDMLILGAPMSAVHFRQLGRHRLASCSAYREGNSSNRAIKWPMLLGVPIFFLWEKVSFENFSNTVKCWKPFFSFFILVLFLFGNSSCDIHNSSCSIPSFISPLISPPLWPFLSPGQFSARCFCAIYAVWLVPEKSHLNTAGRKLNLHREQSSRNACSRSERKKIKGSLSGNL